MLDTIQFDSSRAKYFLLSALLGIFLGVILIWLVVQNQYEVLFAFVVLIPLWALALRNWKWAIYGLAVYLPFAGLPTILFNEYSSYTVLLKDFMFVLPAYLGFLLSYRNRKQPVLFACSPIMLFAAFIGLVILQLFNAGLDNFVVGLIGLKVWVMYMPLYFLGYHLIDSKEQLFRFFKMILFVGLVPVLVGLAQAFLVYTGQSDLAFAIYGETASSVTQGFFATVFDTGQSLSRISSTFTFTGQFSFFLVGLLPISYAMWLKESSNSGKGIWYLLILFLVILAALLSGSRATFLLFPAFILVATFLVRRRRFMWEPLAGFAGGLVAVTLLLGTQVGSIYTVVGNLAGDYLFVGQVDAFTSALDTTVWGLGPGTSTGPARYALSRPDLASFVMIENFYGKVVYELGVIGLAILLMLFAHLLWDSFKVYNLVRDEGLHGVAVTLFTFFMILVVYFWKGNVLDYDPLNVYFWLFAGIVMRLPYLEQRAIEGQMPSSPKEILGQHG